MCSTGCSDDPRLWAPTQTPTEGPQRTGHPRRSSGFPTEEQALQGLVHHVAKHHEGQQGLEVMNEVLGVPKHEMRSHVRAPVKP